MNARDVIEEAKETAVLATTRNPSLMLAPFDDKLRLAVENFLSTLAAAGRAIYDTRTHAAVPIREESWDPTPPAAEAGAKETE